MSDLLVLTGELVTLGPLRIRSGLPAADTDAPLRTDQLRRPLVPGTSLAGALRSACRRRDGAAAARELFGGAHGDDRPSKIVVHDAVHKATLIPDPERRHHVGMDRERLAAVRGVLFDEEVWPQGLRLALRLEAPTAAVPQVLGALDELAGPRGGLGAGACPVVVKALRCARADRSPATAVAAALLRWSQPDHAPWPPDNAQDLPPRAAPTAKQPGIGWVKVDLTVRCNEPLAARVPLDPGGGHDQDNLPFTVTRLADGQVERTVGLPASSLRGVLRQRAERLCALAGRPIDHPWSEGLDIDHPVALLFGWAPAADEGAAARLRVSDLVAAEDWSSLPPAEHPRTTTLQRVRIDRLTGSTLASGKFDDTVVRAGTRLRGTLAIAPADGSVVDPIEIALLAGALRDLARGTTGVGGSSHSGYGSLQVEHATLRWAELTDLEPGDPVELGSELHWPNQLVDPGREAWSMFTSGAR